MIVGDMRLSAAQWFDNVSSMMSDPVQSIRRAVQEFENATHRAAEFIRLPRSAWRLMLVHPAYEARARFFAGRSYALHLFGFPIFKVLWPWRAERALAEMLAVKRVIISTGADAKIEIGDARDTYVVRGWAGAIS